MKNTLLFTTLSLSGLFLIGCQLDGGNQSDQFATETLTYSDTGYKGDAVAMTTTSMNALGTQTAPSNDPVPTQLTYTISSATVSPTGGTGCNITTIKSDGTTEDTLFTSGGTEITGTTTYISSSDVGSTDTVSRFALGVKSTTADVTCSLEGILTYPINDGLTENFSISTTYTTA